MKRRLLTVAGCLIVAVPFAVTALSLSETMVGLLALLMYALCEAIGWHALGKKSEERSMDAQRRTLDGTSP